MMVTDAHRRTILRRRTRRATSAAAACAIALGFALWAVDRSRDDVLARLTAEQSALESRAGPAAALQAQIASLQQEETVSRAVSATRTDPLRVIAALGLVGVLINNAILTRLIAIVVTVRQGDPFVAANAYRLNAIAWFLLGLQILGLVIAAIGHVVSTHEHPLELDAGFSINGWLAVLLTFVLARVFAEGAVMREDLEGTV
jgi:NAD(P)-dependent dehydrogenase (short-subunit alcohol dehydrogenase family)